MLSFNQLIKTTLILLTMMLVTFSCSTTTKITATNYHLRETPPGVVKIADDFYCDKTEVTNIDWMEYMYWTMRIFGANSSEYNSTLPDTLVWADKFDCLKSYETNYLREPAFNYYPVVGITQQQAKGYSKWRADRVFEMILVKLRIIKYDAAQNSKTYFTIEKYFNGTYHNTRPDKRIKYFPDYRLPTLNERNQIVQYADTVDSMYFDTCTSKYCADYKDSFPVFLSGIETCVEDSTRAKPPIDAHYSYTTVKSGSIFNFRGNVGEWAFENGVTLGGSWVDNRETVLQLDTFHIDKQNCWTGFRNVCQWKQWEE